MNSRPLVIASIAAGIAIGYIAGFLTYYNTLSNVQAVNARDVQHELDELKSKLERADMKFSVFSEDNEKLRSSLTQIRASNEELQKRINSLQESLSDPEGSLSRIEQGIILLHIASEPMPSAGEELMHWRVTVVNETAKLDPTLVPAMLKLVDAWADIVQFEQDQPEAGTQEWNDWNAEWQEKALTYISAYNAAVTQITGVMIEDVDSMKVSLSG